MPSQLALVAFIALIVWLFNKERQSREPMSAALWLPLIWAFIIGSRPVSIWLETGAAAESTIDYLEGSPLDRMILFILIASGLLVILRRRESWARIIANNKWVFAFYFYLMVSVLWSDYTFVSFKRWTKDFGHIVMALVVLSERNPAEAVRSVLLRAACLLVPLSVMAAKYFPDIGRYYDRWSYSVYFSGVAGDKNLLGMMLFVCGLFLFDLFLRSRKQPGETKRLSPMVVILLMFMTVWLLMKANSVTAILSTALSAATLFVLRRSGAKKLVIYGLCVAVLVVFLSSAYNVTSLVGKLLGRDTTLTGRTEIWRSLLGEKVNPLVGVGFYSFWLGERSDRISQQYHYTINEAHNGYLEVYLNNGLIGLFLLLMLVGAAVRSQWHGLKLNTPGAAFRFSFLIGTIMYGMSEATFNRLSIVWFTFLLTVLAYPPPREEPEVWGARRVSAAETPGVPAQ